MKWFARAGALFSGIICFSACGRYAPPVSPEVTSPESVEVVEVAQMVGDSSARGGLAIKWLAPERDVRGEPLKELWGYKVYRHVGEVRSGEDGSGISARGQSMSGKRGDSGKVKFEKIGEVPDSTVAKLRTLQKKAREEGQVERKVKLSREDRMVNFVDSGFRPGDTYLYKITPINSSFVAPEVDRIVKVKSGSEGLGLSPRFEVVVNPEYSMPQAIGEAGFEDEMLEE